MFLVIRKQMKIPQIDKIGEIAPSFVVLLAISKQCFKFFTIFASN